MGDISRRTQIWLTVGTLIACAMLLAAAYQRGIERGLDGAISIVPVEGWAYAAAISDHVYHLNLGYVASNKVYAEFEKVFSDPAISADESLARRRNKQLINEVFQRAAHLSDISISSVGAIDQHTIFPMYYLDLGFVDFAKIAFRLFGLEVESLYKLHFLLLGTSIVCFIMAFPGRPLAAVLALGISLAYFCQISSTLFGPYVVTVFGMHESAVLGVMPAFQLTLLLLWRKRFGLFVGIGTAISIAVLLLVIEIRGSAKWALIAVAAVVAVRTVYVIARSWRRESDRRIVVIAAAASLCRWPLVLIVLLAAGQQLWIQTRLHPIYEADDVLTRHGLWHTLYLNCTYWDPDALALSGYKSLADAPDIDSLGFKAATNYAAQLHLFVNPAALVSPITGSYRWGVEDALLKRWFFEHYSQHPGRLLQQFLITKPIVVLQKIFTDERYAFPRWTKLVAFAGGAAFLLLLLAMQPDSAEALRLLASLTIVAVASAIPLIIGFPDPSYVLEVMVTWPLLVCLGIPLAVYLTWPGARRWFRSGLAIRFKVIQ
jgi:hypothetical protein